MALPKEEWVTPEEYLAREREAETRSEYLAGRIYAMAGATRRHNLLSSNLTRMVGQRLVGHPCECYSHDMRVTVSETGLYTYPDMVVTCDPVFLGPGEDNLLNPRVIFEVISPSTELYDRTEKFEHYRTIESLSDYVLVSQDLMRVEHFVRQPDRKAWSLTVLTGPEEVLDLTSIDSRLPLADIYDKVALEDIEGGLTRRLR